MKLAPIKAVLAALPAALLSSACCGERPAEPAEEAPAAAAPADAPNLVLVVLDTVRRDHLSTWGYGRETSPSLTRLARRGALFTAASSAASWTHPSHASMLTGCYPSEHGARYSGPGGEEGEAILAMGRDVPTLQRILGEAGYETVASVGAPVLSPGLGVTRGFGSFSGAPPDEEPPAEEVSRRALESIDGLDGGRPFFLLVNYYDAHSPYIARPERAPWLRGRDGPRLVDVARAEGGLPRFARIAAGLEAMAPETRRAALDNYDSEIARADAALGDLVAALERRGHLERAVVAITSDHGEYFGEHGLYDHGRTLYREMTDVPLAILGRGVAGGTVVEAPVQTIDLFPTFLEAAGLPTPPSSRGSSLWPLLAGGAGRAHHPVAAEAFADPAVAGAAPIFSSGYRSLEEGGLKLIARDDGSRAVELYDLGADPGETRDVAASRSADAERMLRALDEWLPARAAGTAPAALSPERREQLERLGYAR